MASNARWQDLYEAAIVEVNPTELRNKFEVAHAVMRQRIEELQFAPDARSVDERRRIEDALKNLAVLEKFELKASLPPSRQTSQIVRGEGL